MMYENEKNVHYMGNGFFAVDIGMGKTIVLRTNNESGEECSKLSSKDKTSCYVKKENGKSDFGEWLNAGHTSDLIDEKELIRKFVLSVRDGVMSYRANGTSHLLLMLGNSFYHYIFDDNEVLSKNQHSAVIINNSKSKY